MTTYADQAESRIYYWQREMPNLVKWVRILPSLLDENFTRACHQLNSLLDYTEQYGELLNIVARIVGIRKRPAIRGDALAYFGYAGNPASQPYDTSPYFDGEATPDTVLVSDSALRGIIAAKIFRNTSAHTIDDYKQMIDTIFGVNCTVIDHKNMTFEIVLNTDTIDMMLYTAVTTASIIQPPQGVSLTAISFR